MNDENYFVMKFLESKGLGVSQIASQLNVSRKTVYYWRKKNSPPSHKTPSARTTLAMRTRRALVKKLASTRVAVDSTRFTPVRRKAVKRRTLSRPYSSVRKIARALFRNNRIECSPSTVLNDFKALGWVARKRISAPFLTDEDKQRRLEFCRKVLEEGFFDFAFSDESLFDTNEQGANNRYQWVPRGGTPDPIQREQYGASLLVWGVIAKDFNFLVIIPSSSGRLTCAKFRELVLTPALTRLRALGRRGIKFQMDNAPCHNRNGDWLRRNGVRLAPKWPARSCDLSPIEPLWAIMKQRVSSRAPFGEENLTAFIRQEWESLPNTLINSLVDSFKRRCELCIRAGGATIRL